MEPLSFDKGSIFFCAVQRENARCRGKTRGAEEIRAMQ
ncbi:hypothetical protein GPDM_15839, partial [Planococcus donghaensis MPA1U2]